MKRAELKRILKERVLVLDGAYGTELSRMGYDAPPEQIVLEKPSVIKKLHADYVMAGANAILTCTFGANPMKLAKYGLEQHHDEIVSRAVDVARKASREALIFGDIGPTGELPIPIGKATFDDYFENFKRTASILLHEGVDAIILETFSDILELKAATLAVRELSKDIFLIANMTFNENARTLTGTDPMNFALTFNDLDVDAIGTNCSLGPQEILPIFEEMSKYSEKLLVVEPDAGSPILHHGNVRYPVGPQDFAVHTDSFWESKANIIGSCCGSSPKYTAMISKKVGKRAPIEEEPRKIFAISSPSKIVDFKEFVAIGERINPAGRKKLQMAMRNSNLEKIMEIAKKQKNAHADVLDVNFGLEQFVSVDYMTEVVNSIAYKIEMPISIDIQLLEALEKVLREYPGRPLINSTRVVEKEMLTKIRLAQRYGGILVVLAMGEHVPTSFKERKSAIDRGLRIAESYNFPQNRIIFDPVILAVGAGSPPQDTLNAIAYLKDNGLKSMVGLSNISFGMPERSYINASFLSVTVSEGLSAAILNPLDEIVMGILRSTLILNGKELKIQEETKDPNSLIGLILSGDEKKLLEKIDVILKDEAPMEVIENYLRPAMDEVGKMYDKSKIFLPQLILAAQTAQKAFEKVQSLFTHQKSSGKFVIATVKGDVHDIGKNIVAAVVKSAGYQVVDMGRDVPAERIVDVVKKERPLMLGLSAMMTTTAPKIKEVTDELKKQKIELPVVVGGASLNEELAKELGADFYARSATDALKYLGMLKVSRG